MRQVKHGVVADSHLSFSQGRMYSDNDFTDVFNGGLEMDIGNTFGLSGDFTTNAFYNNIDPTLQTVPQRQQTQPTALMGYSGCDDDIPVGDSMLGSPQPLTVKKLKTQLSGVGGEGGYLTSPMGMSKGRRCNDINIAESLASAQVGRSPERAIMQEIRPYQNSNRAPSISAPAMQRFRSAPPSTSVAPSSSSVQTNGLRNQESGKANNIGLGIPGSSLGELDYGSMRIYGRPLQRSASEDPATDSSRAGASGFLPYPEHLPTITLGRGVKNARDINSSSQHESFPVKQEPMAAAPSHHSNLDKPFIQYVPPNSPAAKSAARNKRHLTIKTENEKPSQKLVAIRMTSPQQAPLSPSWHPPTVNSPSKQKMPQTSPTKPAYNYTSSYMAGQALSAPLPSFEFSLEQFGGLDYSQNATGVDADGQYDLHAMLGLPTPGFESGSSVSSSGMLSPPHSAASTHSSVFSQDEEMMYGLPPSPFFDQPNTMGNSIDQALANLLNDHQLSAQPQQQSLPNHDQQQTHFDVASVSGSPANVPSPSQIQWSPYHAQSISSNNYASFVDPSVQLANSENLLLSPQSAHYFHNATVDGRPISSPRRLRGMQSAPDLNQAYKDPLQNVLRSPTPRQATLKRQRTYYSPEGEEVDENAYLVGQEESISDLEEDDEYQPDQDYDLAPPSKRRSSSAFAYAPQSASNFPLVNPNPSRLRPGPKPKSSLPNLQAVHQSVFTVAVNAPPVPSLPINYASYADNLAVPSATSPLPSPDPMLSLAKEQGANVSKDVLANFYVIGTGAKQTKKGKPQRMYICSIPGCMKEFPRKSAVESHIQTHLEDKPFACPYDEW